MSDVQMQNPIWNDILLGKIQVDLKFLAGKILLSRWQLALRRDFSPINLERAKADVITLYENNIHLANAKKDVESILNPTHSLVR